MRKRRTLYPEAAEGGFELSAVGDAKILGRLGEGVSCAVYDAHWRGRDVVIKLYKPAAVERHKRLVGGELAHYEFKRNQAFWNAGGLRKFVAEPLAYRVSAGISLFVQERLHGELYYDHYTTGGNRSDASLRTALGEIVERAHAAALYDIDLHAGNTMVVANPRGGELIPKLFDFNRIPFYVHAPNPAVWLAFRLGLIDRGWRDRRKLAAFHDFSRYRRKLAKYGEPRTAVLDDVSVNPDRSPN